VCWTERLETGEKREIEVTCGGGRLVWRFRVDKGEWDRTCRPSPADWDELVSRMEDRYQRRNIPIEDLELARRLRAQGSAG
jgi:hypothetical protein